MLLKAVNKSKLTCSLVKVRRRFSILDMQVCFLLNEGPSAEETPSRTPSALTAPTKILCGLQRGPSMETETAQQIYPQYMANRSELGLLERELWVKLQQAQTGSASNPATALTSMRLQNWTHFWPRNAPTHTWTDEFCDGQPGTTASPNHTRLPALTTR